MKYQVKISCSGVVQGIGFRPFVFREAVSHNLKGFVRNEGDAGVLIVVEGEKKNIMQFIRRLQFQKPYLAKYEDFKINWGKHSNLFLDFSIDKSSDKKLGGISYLPPDLSICNDCLKDMNKIEDLRYNYAFSSCAICGPRYTTIEKLPYDRINTTMANFPLCSNCSIEYQNPLNRRYHAETTCCLKCGPILTLYNQNLEKINSKDVFVDVTQLIQEGNIVAIKGIGGTHLACSALNDEPILKLRTLKGKRKSKPFALISKSISEIKKFAHVNILEETLLTSFRKPIVLLKKKKPFLLSKLLSPNLFNIGVMLPYSGIHFLILNRLQDPAMVLTSANPSDIPMFIEDNQILNNMKNLADYILIHNRRIFQRADDSVIRLTNNIPTLIRRSRGWVPEPINIPFSLKEQRAMGVGSLLTSTGTIALKNRCFLTQYIGDVETIESLDFLDNSLNHLQTLLGIKKFDVIGCDLHPSFLSTSLALKKSILYNAHLSNIQHHFAHSIALMLDNQLPLEDEIVSIVADGTGYGSDGSIWGGEILHCSYKSFTRIGHLKEQLLVGGDRAIIYPIRIFAGILYNILGISEIENLLSNEYKNSLPGGENEIQVLLVQLKDKINTFKTTSTGRILDAISAILNLCKERTYEGEPALILESIASSGTPNRVNFNLESPTSGIIDTTRLISAVYEAFKLGIKVTDIALSAHYELANQFANVAIEYAKKNSIRKIGFTGGVAYNEYITKQIAKKVKKANIKFLQHHSLPPGDGSISCGQAINAALKNR